MLATLLLTCMVAGAAPPTEGNRHLDRAKRLIAELKEREALFALDQARKAAQREPQLLAQVYQYEGIAYAGLADQQHAIQSFQSAVVLDPELQLPFGLSPRVREWWEKAGGKVPAPSPEVVATAPDVPVAPPAAPALAPNPAPAPQPVVVARPEEAPAGTPAGRKLGLVGVGLGGAAVLSAAVFGVLTFTTANAAQADPVLASARRQHLEAERWALVATVTGSAGLALAVIGALVAIFAPASG